MSPIASRRLNRTSWLAIALALIALQTAIRIEVQNRAAGDRLPVRPEANGFIPRWRHLPWTTPERWHRMFGPRDASGNPVERPLTADETSFMNESIKRLIQRNELLDLVQSWGVAQYVVVPLMMILAISNVLRGDLDSIVSRSSRADQIAGWGLLALGIALGILMMFRGYLTSLGY